MAKKKASKQKKMDTRVNFTPMVDMMMLLITFFMLCTTLSKPQAMQLTMPSNDPFIWVVRTRSTTLLVFLTTKILSASRRLLGAQRVFVTCLSTTPQRTAPILLHR